MCCWLLASLTSRCLLATLSSSAQQWDLDISGYNLIYLCWEAVVYFLATLAIELAGSVPWIAAYFTSDPGLPVPDQVRAFSSSCCGLCGTHRLCARRRRRTKTWRQSVSAFSPGGEGPIPAASASVSA